MEPVGANMLCVPRESGAGLAESRLGPGKWDAAEPYGTALSTLSAGAPPTCGPGTQPPIRNHGESESTYTSPNQSRKGQGSASFLTSGGTPRGDVCNH